MKKTTTTTTTCSTTRLRGCIRKISVPMFCKSSQIYIYIYIYIYIQMKRIEVNGVESCNSEFFVHFKLSYSCMSKVKSIISRHNKAQIGKSLNPPEEIKDNCNCRIKNSCPLEGNCNVRNIVYQAEVVTPQSKETYIGFGNRTFKQRYRNHTCSFRNERYKNVTGLTD